jgi:GNAT superfamily N-acetyltransferase
VTGFSICSAVLDDMHPVARLHRHVRRTCLPYLPDLHTPDEDLAFFQGQVFPNSTIWLAKAGAQLIGVAVARQDWLDHLYVDPVWHGRGVGRALLLVAEEGARELNLWTFQQNAQAQRFYERQGFKLVELTDGAANEEGLPDAHYRWTRA